MIVRINESLELVDFPIHERPSVRAGDRRGSGQNYDGCWGGSFGPGAPALSFEVEPGRTVYAELHGLEGPTRGSTWSCCDALIRAR